MLATHRELADFCVINVMLLSVSIVLHCSQVSGPTLIVFLLKGPVYLVATSSLGEPVVVLHRQLELMYRQVVLVVATGAPL